MYNSILEEIKELKLEILNTYCKTATKNLLLSVAFLCAAAGISDISLFASLLWLASGCIFLYLTLIDVCNVELYKNDVDINLLNS